MRDAGRRSGRRRCARRGGLLLVIPLLAGPLSAEEGVPPPRPLTARERVHHFLSRFTLGPTKELMAEVDIKGIDAWLEEQLQPGRPESPALESRLEPLQSINLTSREILARYVSPIPPGASPEVRRRRQRMRNLPPRELVDSVLFYAVYSPRQVQEAAADFFRNHFTVAIDKGQVRYFATEYEREVIRAGVFGSFGDMLRKSAKSPAMLVYLDNAVSRRPPTKAELKKIEISVRLKTKSKQRGREASDIAAQRGLNENYARELLELHTLGVDNYYRQRDVESVARALTGWTFANKAPDPIVFAFRPNMHAGGDKPFLHLVIRQNRKDPQAEGEKVLDTLIKHKGTARFVAFKLCRYFVNDDPPADLVERIAAVFRKTKGDLPSVYRAIVNDPEFFARRNYRAKFKRPFEFVVSALRATGAEIARTDAIHKALQAMSEPIYLCKDPTGYYDQAEAWRDPGAFAVRWKFAMDLATGKIPGVKIPASFYDDLRMWKPEDWKERLVKRLLPEGLDRRTSHVLDGMIAKYLKSHPEPEIKDLAPRIVGMLLGSPGFQKQ